MKKNIIKILILMFILGCKEKPNYNPFDKQFDISVSKLVKDNCDTILAGCGYFNLRKKEGKLKPYYQIYINDFNQVVAKGFNYELDTFKVKNFQDRYSRKSNIDSILSLRLDKKEMNKEFGLYGYSINSINKDKIEIINSKIMNTIILNLDVFPIYQAEPSETAYLVRGIHYFVSPERDE